MNSILIRTFARGFYLAHAEVFFILLALIGGIMRGQDHVILAGLLVEDPMNLFIPFTVWVIYTLRSVHYYLGQPSKLEYQWTYQLKLFPRWKQILQLSGMHLTTLLPVVAYALFLANTALEAGKSDSLLALIAMVVALVVLPVVFYYFQLFQVRERSKGGVPGFQFLSFRPVYLWSILDFIKTKWVAFFIMKLLAIGLIYTTQILYDKGESVIVIALGGLTAFMVNAMFCYHQIHFQLRVSPMINNMPLPFWLHWRNMMIPIAVLCLPEVITLLSSVTWYHLGVVVFGLVVLVNVNAFQLLRQADFDGFLKGMFVTYLLLFVFLLFGIQPWWLAVILGGISLITYSRYYYLLPDYTGD